MIPAGGGRPEDRGGEAASEAVPEADHPPAPEPPPGSRRVPRLHVVAPDAVADRAGFASDARDVLAEGGRDVALHLRLKAATGRRIHDLALRVREEAELRGGWCVVNERLDVALAVGAHGVQLGAGALPVGRARELAPPAVAVGASVHGPAGARRAVDEGANFLLLGTIFDSATHPDREGAGPGLVAACAELAVPVVAIGGLTPERVPAVTGAGAHGVAAVRAVWGAEEPGQAVAAFLTALEGA